MYARVPQLMCCDIARIEVRVKVDGAGPLRALSRNRAKPYHAITSETHSSAIYKEKVSMFLTSLSIGPDLSQILSYQ